MEALSVSDVWAVLWKYSGTINDMSNNNHYIRSNIHSMRNNINYILVIDCQEDYKLLSVLSLITLSLHTVQ